MSKRFKGRSAVACQACHVQKLKCSGGTPCQRCQTRDRSCVYPVKERILAVPESYIRGLEAHLYTAEENVAGIQPQQPVQVDHIHIPIPSDLNNELAPAERLSDECSAERFVQKMKELSSLATINEQPPDQAINASSPSASRYTYAKLDFDFIRSGISIKLPPRPYAFHLLDVFEEGFSDYHWFLRRRFRKRLSLTYSDPTSQADDRNWLCRVSVVLALAETWNRGRNFTQNDSTHAETHIISEANMRTSSASNLSLSNSLEELPSAPPGSELFEQCLLLLKLSLEEPTIEDVEALNIISCYSYTLNRRKTAFFHARQSLSLAKLLSLDKPWPPSNDPEQRIQAEHRKRVWWTSYCMDRMVSTDLGIAAMQETIPTALRYPDFDHIPDLARDEFFEPYLLTARVELSIIQAKVVETVTQHLRLNEELESVDMIAPCSKLIQDWHERLPLNLSFSFETSIPLPMLNLPFHRVLASLYLRYHQCIILLYRPFVLQELASVIKQNASNSQRGITSAVSPRSTDASAPLKIQCLEAARSNCRILVHLRIISKVAKYGYWEALHLFTGLAILSLSRVLNLSPAAPQVLHTPIPGIKLEDNNLFAEGRDLLDEMSRVGNLAARDFKVMLGDVENMVERVREDWQKTQTRAVPSFWDPIRPEAEPNPPWYTANSDIGLLDSILEEEIWYNIDWENILRI